MTKSIAFLFLITLASFGVYLQIPLKNNHIDEKIINRPRFGGTYLRSLAGNPTTLDPAMVMDATSSEIVTQIFSRLLRMNHNLEIKPELVESWRISEDKKIYTFKLKQKIRFHTITGESTLSANRGREITAHDIKYTLERILSPELNSPHRLSIYCIKGAEEFYKKENTELSGFKIIDNFNFEIHLNYPFSPFLSILTTAPLGIVPKEDVQKLKEDFANHPVGSGAFIFESFTRDQNLVLRSNLDYHKGRPYLDRIVFSIRQNDRNQFENFLKGELHHLERLHAIQLREVMKKHQFDFQEISSLEITYLGMNVTLPPFDNLNVRKAFNHLINKQMIVRYIKKNRGLAAKGPLPPGINDYNPVLEAYDYDPEKARKLLREAGYRFNDQGLILDFPQIELQASHSEGTLAVAQAIQANLADIGIRLKLNFTDLSSHYEAIDNGRAPFFFLGWLADYPDSDNILYYNFHSHNIGTNNSSFYNNPKVDKLLDMARFTENEEERKRLYQEAEQLIVNDAPWVFLYYPTTYVVVSPVVRGFQLSPFGISEIDYYNIWLAEEEKFPKKH
jgi:peptide/nickel transport system substrate-binding protein/oligopeptide transport system substrate-binding protein